MRIRKPLMDCLERLEPTSCDRDGLNTHLGLVNLDSNLLFAQEYFTTCLFLQSSYMQINNSKLKWSFPTKLFYSKCASLLSDLTYIKQNLPQVICFNIQDCMEVKISEMKLKPTSGTISIL